MPAGLVPMRLAATVLRDDPASVMPFPPLPEMTFATTPDAPDGFSPIGFPDDDRATKTPSPRLPAAAPARLRPM